MRITPQLQKFKQSLNDRFDIIKNSINISKSDINVLDISICNDLELMNKVDNVLIKLGKLTENYAKKPNYSKH